MQSSNLEFEGLVKRETNIANKIVLLITPLHGSRTRCLAMDSPNAVEM